MRSIVLATALSLLSTNAIAQDQAAPSKEGLWSKIKRITTEEVGNSVSINGKSVGAVQSTPKTPDGREYRRLADTPLQGIFNAEAAINADYPHLAITITDYSDRIVERGINPTSPTAPIVALMGCQGS